MARALRLKWEDGISIKAGHGACWHRLAGTDRPNRAVKIQQFIIVLKVIFENRKDIEMNYSKKLQKLLDKHKGKVELDKNEMAELIAAGKESEAKELTEIDAFFTACEGKIKPMNTNISTTEKNRLRKLQDRFLKNRKVIQWVKNNGANKPVFGPWSPSANDLKLYLYAEYTSTMQIFLADYKNERKATK